MRYHLLSALLMLIAISAPAAGPETPVAPVGPASDGPKRTITVAAAANLKIAAERLKKGFETEQPGVVVMLTFGASGAFYSQIQNGAPFDLFLSADREYPAKLIAAKLGDAADERIYALGQLVVWLPRGTKANMNAPGLEGLLDPSVRRIAIANPAVAPFGRATIAALRAAGVEGALKDRLVLGESVAQAAQFVTTGAADVAFLPFSLTFAKELSDGYTMFVPEELYPKIEQSGIVLSRSREPALARAFLAYITGTKGREILAKFGYGLP